MKLSFWAGGVVLAGLFFWSVGWAVEPYDLGQPVLSDIWVDPVNGREGADGSSAQRALKGLDEALARIPRSQSLVGTGYRILLQPGDYTEDLLPDNGWVEDLRGTYNFPVIIQAAQGQGTVRLKVYWQFFQCSYLYLIDLDMVTALGYGSGSNVLHVSSCDHMLIRGCRLEGYDGAIRQPQETLKINQGQYIYVEDSQISGANWFALDFVAVQYGHILNNVISDCDEDCLVLKGGTAYLTVAGNEVCRCGVVGLSAGQGTGFEYMVNPWMHYEAYDLKFYNNVVHDVTNAGLAVRGGYNILLAYNTFYQIGYDERQSALLLFSPGSRSCDGDEAACRERHSLGGWGPVTAGQGGEWIPNRHVYVFNNVFYNPVGVAAQSGHFRVFGPVDVPGGANIPSPSRSDEDLMMRGNVIFNGDSGMPLGIEGENSGCGEANSTCNETQLRGQNTINQVEPELTAPESGDFRPTSGGNMYRMTTFAVPDFAGNDRPQPPLSPEGDLSNQVMTDRSGNPRISSGPPGAYVN